MAENRWPSAAGCEPRESLLHLVDLHLSVSSITTSPSPPLYNSCILPFPVHFSSSFTRPLLLLLLHLCILYLYLFPRLTHPRILSSPSASLLPFNPPQTLLSSTSSNSSTTSNPLLTYCVRLPTLFTLTSSSFISVSSISTAISSPFHPPPSAPPPPFTPSL